MRNVNDAEARLKMKECLARDDLAAALEWAGHIRLTEEELASQRESWVRGEMALGGTSQLQQFPDITAIQYLWIEKQRRDRRQQAMLQWAQDTFGAIQNFDPCSIEERALRFLEEAIELCQAVGVTRQEIETVADYVFGRQPGNPAQEIGGVMVTLNCLAEVLGESICAAELDEWQRVQSKTRAHFEARHRTKMEVGL